MSDVTQWDPVATNNQDPVPDGFPEGQPASTLNDCSREVMASVRRFAEDGGWFDWGHSITYISPTQFSVPGDLSAVYAVGRRLRITGAITNVVYATITDVAFTTITTVTIAPDAGTVQNEALAVSLGPEAEARTPVPTPSIPSGSKMLFAQAAAPSGWTLDGANDDVLIRVNGTAGGATGGSWTISGISVDGHALTVAELPPHQHEKGQNVGCDGVTFSAQDINGPSNQETGDGSTQGLNGDAHTHGLTVGDTWRPAYLDVIVCTKN